MSHNLFHDQMAWVGGIPWHGLGRRVPPDVTADVMIKAAGLDWSVNKSPAAGARLDARRGGYDRYLLLRDPVHSDTTPVALGLVRAGYEVLQNIEAFRFFQPFIDKGYARYESAGALGNGERIWVLAKLVDPIFITPSDEIRRYLLLSNSHDGRGAVSVGFTPIRVVCQNTLNFALNGGKAAVAIRHTKNVSSNLLREQADKLEVLTDKVYADVRALFLRMAERRINPTETTSYLEAIFPWTEKQRHNQSKPLRWKRVESILEDEIITPAETRGTLWALYNAVTRDEDYRESTEGQDGARLERIWFGKGEALELAALSEARRLLVA
jgi:phage/plasmid-like protein (TIGR03299 family)